MGMKLRHVGWFNNSRNSGYFSIDELILLFDIALGNCSVENLLFQFVRRISSVVSKFPIGNLKLVCLHQLFRRQLLDVNFERAITSLKANLALCPAVQVNMSEEIERRNL